MAYFKINEHDYSNCVSGLSVKKQFNYTSQTNAAGDSVIDYTNQKIQLDVTIIPLDEAIMRNFQADVDGFNLDVEFRHPQTGELKNINCVVANIKTEYYTIQQNKVMFKEFKIQFTEI